MPLLKSAASAALSSWAKRPKPIPQPEEVIRDLRARDERDRNRADSPLKPAPDAVLLDSTGLTLDETVAAAEAIVHAKLEQLAVLD